LSSPLTISEQIQSTLRAHDLQPDRYVLPQMIITLAELGRSHSATDSRPRPTTAGAFSKPATADASITCSSVMRRTVDEEPRLRNASRDSRR
jgi:hypothetical protein